MLNAESEAQTRVGFVTGLENQLITKKLELATLKRQFIKIDDPEIIKVENHINDLQEQINIERKYLSGTSDDALNQKVIEYEKLNNALLFSKEMYRASLLTYEKTKSDSLQKQRFMAILSKPYLPENQWYYWRHKGFLTSVSVLLVSYFLLKFFMGIADSHNY